jgi:hypothetical protein
LARGQAREALGVRWLTTLPAASLPPCVRGPSTRGTKANAVSRNILRRLSLGWNSTSFCLAARFRPVAVALANLPVTNAWLDGEDLRGKRLLDRKAALRPLIRPKGRQTGAAALFRPRHRTGAGLLPPGLPAKARGDHIEAGRGALAARSLGPLVGEGKGAAPAFAASSGPPSPSSSSATCWAASGSSAPGRPRPLSACPGST